MLQAPAFQPAATVRERCDDISGFDANVTLDRVSQYGGSRGHGRRRGFGGRRCVDRRGSQAAVASWRTLRLSSPTRRPNRMSQKRVVAAYHQEGENDG